MSVHLLLLALASAACLVLWLWIIQRWQRGLEAYLLYLPIGGAVQNLLYPAAWPVLIKDVAFAIPVYIGIAMSGEAARSLTAFPRYVAALVALFAGIVAVQVFNPAGPGMLATLIGFKVWLFYLPMLFVGWCYVSDERNLLRLSRVMISLIWLPCLVGIAQWLLSLAYGYEYTMRSFYGEGGVVATQGLATFDVGIIRIPSTFSFSAQYLNYILCMFVPVLGCGPLETDLFWRRLRVVSIWLLCLAGFMTGARAAFIFVPGMLACFYFLNRGVLGQLRSALMVVLLFMVAIWLTGIDLQGLFQMENELARVYSREAAMGQLVDSFKLTWLGRGVGTATGAARFSLADPSIFTTFENFYAKTQAEMGFPGLAIVAILQLTIVRWALRLHSALACGPLQAYCDAITSLLLVLMIYDFKGVILDFDPMNMAFWLFTGVLFALPAIQPGFATQVWLPAEERGTGMWPHGVKPARVAEAQRSPQSA